MSSFLELFIMRLQIHFQMVSLAQGPRTLAQIHPLIYTEKHSEGIP